MCAGISLDYVALLRQWKCDTMFRYLRTQATSMHLDNAQRMLDHGDYTFDPGTYIQDRKPLPDQTPAAFRALLDHPNLYDGLEEDDDLDLN